MPYFTQKDGDGMTDTLKELEKEWHKAGAAPTITPLDVILAGDKLLTALKEAHAEFATIIEGHWKEKARLLEDNTNIRVALKKNEKTRELSREKNTRLCAAIDGLNVDWHNRSERGCGTCQALTDAMGKPIGCIHYAIEAAERRERRKTPEGDGG